MNRKNADDARRLGAALPRESELIDPVTEIIAAQLTRSWADRDDALRKTRYIVAALEGAGYTVTPRASQAATATNGARDDAGAAHDPHGGSAGHTALRDRILHVVQWGCTGNPDCGLCAERADAIKAEVQPVLDQHWADLACRTNERDQWREEARRMHQSCDHWRKRAEAAEAQLRDQNGHHT